MLMLKIKQDERIALKTGDRQLAVLRLAYFIRRVPSWLCGVVLNVDLAPGVVILHHGQSLSYFTQLLLFNGEKFGVTTSGVADAGEITLKLDRTGRSNNGVRLGFDLNTEIRIDRVVSGEKSVIALQPTG